MKKMGQGRIMSAFLKTAAVVMLLCMGVMCLCGCSEKKKILYLPEHVELGEEGGQSQTADFVYDENGFLKEIRFSEDGTIQVTCDENGNVILCTQEITQGGQTFNYSNTYTYSTRGNMLSYVKEVAGEVRFQRRWEYNTLNQPVSYTNITISASGQTTTKKLFEYDKSGKLIAAHTYHDNEHFSDTTFTYDADGRRLLEECVHVSGRVLSRAHYTYENGSTVIAIEKKVVGDITKTTVHTYDYAGYLVQVDDGTDTWIYRQTYREVEVPANSPRRCFTWFGRLSETGYSD